MFGNRRALPTVRSSPAHDIDRAAKPVFEGELPSAWQRQDGSGGQDYGIDYFVEIIESFAPTGVRFAVQLKGVKQPRIVSDAIHFPFPTRNLGTYVQTEHLPVFLVVADVTKKAAWFLFLQQHADEHLSEDEWADQETVTVKVPLENRVSDHERLQRDAREAQRYMLALRASPAMALRRRSRWLERLDPRVSVQARATETGEVYEVSAKEPFSFKMGFAGIDSERMGLLRRGYAIPVANGEVVFDGMPIFDRFAGSPSEIQISKDVTTTATIEVERDGVIATLVNVPAKVTFGMEEFRIAAAYANAPIGVNVVVNLQDRNRELARGSVSVSLVMDHRWLGQPVCDLAHFDRLAAVTEIVAKPYRVRMRLHVPGDDDLEMPWSTALAFPGNDFDDYEHAIGVLRRAREVSRLLGINPRLPANALTANIGDVELLHKLLTVGEYERAGSNVTFVGETPKRSAYTDQFANSRGKPMAFVAEPAGAQCKWDFLGERVAMPVHLITLSRAKCSVKRANGMLEIVAKGTRDSRLCVKRDPPEEPR